MNVKDDPLPLFPLPVVLFPGVGIPLHIFEPRYRRMVTDVLAGDGRFGLLYHDPDESGPFLNESGRVGTVATIRKHEPLPDGRSLILVQGGDRFAIVREAEAAAPYYQAAVESYEDLPVADPSSLVTRRRRSLSLIRKVLDSLPHAQESLPSFDPEKELSFKLAALARMDGPAQQEILKMRAESARLDVIDPLFRLGMDGFMDGGGAEA